MARRARSVLVRDPTHPRSFLLRMELTNGRRQFQTNSYSGNRNDFWGGRFPAVPNLWEIPHAPRCLLDGSWPRTSL